MENSNYDCNMKHPNEVNEACYKNENKELKDGRRITAKRNANHYGKKQRNPMKKQSSNTEHERQLENSSFSENGKNFLRDDEKTELEFCSRHDLESINNSTITMKSIPRELIESIRKLPSEINAFLTESSFVCKTERLKSNHQKQSKTESDKKSRTKFTKDGNSMSSQRKGDSNKAIMLESSEEEPIKDSKSRISYITYFQNFISKPQGFPTTSLKSKSSSNLKLNKNKNKSNPLKKTQKRVTSPKKDSKHNLRADYIEWLLAEKKFFNISDPNCSAENRIRKTKPEKEENVNYNSQGRQLKRKQSKRHHNHRKVKKGSGILLPTENTAAIKKNPLLKHSDKNYGLFFNEMTNRNVTPEQLHHIRWLASVENINQIKSKEFIRRTISLNELYSYIPTHDRENTESIAQSYNDEKNGLTKKFRHLNYENVKINNDPTEKYQEQLNLIKITNNLEEKLKLNHKLRTNSNEAVSDIKIKESVESIESVSIEINKSVNKSNSYESLNIGISSIYNEEDSLIGGPLKGKVQDTICNDELILCSNSVNYHKNSDDENQHKPNFNCSIIFKTPTNAFANNQEIVKSYFCQNFKYNPSDISHQLDKDLTNEITLSSSRNQCQRNYYTPIKINKNKEEEKYIHQIIRNENGKISLSNNNNHIPLIKNTIRDLIMDETDELINLTDSKSTYFSENLKKKYSNKIRFTYDNSHNACENLSDDSSIDNDIVINRLVHKIKSEEKRNNKSKTPEKRFISDGITEIFSEKSKEFTFTNSVTNKQVEATSSENIVIPVFREVKRAKSVKIINSTAVQCDIESSSSAGSIPMPIMNKKRKYDADNDDEIKYNNISDNVREHTIIIQSNCSSLCSCTSKNDEKQNEILLVMTELRQKLNFIQDQISFMNVNHHKCDNIEATLENLKADVSFGLRHVHNTFKSIELDNKNFEKTKLKSEPNILIRTRNLDKRLKIIKSLDTLMMIPLIINKNNSLKSEYFKIEETDHKIFCNVLNNLTHQLKSSTSKEEKLDDESKKGRIIESREIGIMTDENPILCNYCCSYTRTTLNKPEQPLEEIEMESDSSFKQSKSTNEKSNEEMKSETQCDISFILNESENFGKIKKEMQFNIIDKQNEAKSEDIIQCIPINTDDITRQIDNSNIYLKDTQIHSDFKEMKKSSFKVRQNKLKMLKSKPPRHNKDKKCVIF